MRDRPIDINPLVKTPSTPIGVMNCWRLGVKRKGTDSEFWYKNVVDDKATERASLVLYQGDLFIHDTHQEPSQITILCRSVWKYGIYGDVAD